MSCSNCMLLKEFADELNSKIELSSIQVDCYSQRIDQIKKELDIV